MDGLIVQDCHQVADMAGRNQHYIPQFAQRPFKTSEPGNRAKTFRYQFDAPPHRSRRIMKTGADEFFYSDDTPVAKPNLDARITALENELSLIHQRLSAQVPGPVENSDEAVKLGWTGRVRGAQSPSNKHMMVAFSG